MAARRHVRKGLQNIFVPLLCFKWKASLLCASKGGMMHVWLVGLYIMQLILCFEDLITVCYDLNGEIHPLMFQRWLSIFDIWSFLATLTVYFSQLLHIVASLWSRQPLLKAHVWWRHWVLLYLGHNLHFFIFCAAFLSLCESWMLVHKG